MDTTTEFEPDVQFDDHIATATDSDMMPARDSDGNDDIPITVMFDTDIDKEEGAEDIGTGREEEIIDDLILCDNAPTYYVTYQHHCKMIILVIIMTVYKVESTDFDVCCMNGIHNKIFFYATT